MNRFLLRAARSKPDPQLAAKLKELVTLDRKLLPDELQFYATYSTILNLGIGPSKFEGEVLRVNMAGRDIAYNLTKRPLARMSEIMFSDLENSLGGDVSEEDLADERKNALQDLRNDTFSKLARIWPEEIDLYLFLAKKLYA